MQKRLIKTTLFLSLLVGTTLTFAQENLNGQFFASYLLKSSNKKSVRKYKFKSDYDTIVVGGGFNQEKIQQSSITGRRIIGVDYVFTKFRLRSEFDQNELNKQRMIRLLSQYPELIGNDVVEWNMYRQSGCDSPEECKEFFHGFVIYLAPVPTKKTVEKEVASLTAKLDSIEASLEASVKVKTFIPSDDCELPKLIIGNAGALADQINAQIKCAGVRKNTHVRFKLWVDTLGNITKTGITGFRRKSCVLGMKELIQNQFKWTSPVVMGEVKPFVVDLRMTYPIKAKQVLNWDRAMSTTIRLQQVPDSIKVQMEYEYKHRRVGLKTYASRKTKLMSCQAYYPGEMMFTYKLPNDNLVAEVLKRNPNWDQSVFVVDVTGSMYPYLAKTMEWLALNCTEDTLKKTFVFFNDGNWKADHKKKIGETGGLYSVTSNEYDEIKSTMIKAMEAGGGGDCPENNGEAVIQALKDRPNATDIIMVADNYAFPRDTELLSGLGRNVHLVMCGSDSGLNLHYLNWALTEGFSVHTIDKDIDNLRKMKEGESIVINGNNYVIQKGKFVRQYRI